jgi:IS30 family transposase
MAAYVHLTADERLQIFAWHREHLPQAEIARRLARSPGTISRELRRNRVAAGYLPHRAQQCYHARRRRCRRRARFDDRRLRRLVLDLLQRGFSPEQIAGRLRAEQGATVVNPETIYRFVYESPLGRQEQLYQYLRRGKKRRTRRQGRRTHSQPIAGRLFIDARPSAAAERTEIGHWESDSLCFTEEQVLNVLVERSSRYALVTRLRNKTAQQTCATLITRLAGLPHLSVTGDNGGENADHRTVSYQLSIPFFFCHPYHSWEKGTVENTNGLLRCYLPRATDLNRLDPQDLEAIAAELNHRPRKCLGFRTPYEVLFNTFVALSY